MLCLNNFFCFMKNALKMTDIRNIIECMKNILCIIFLIIHMNFEDYLDVVFG